MASPQLEDGYTRVANELLEALIAAPLSGQELRIALTVIRKTYGYGGKKVDRISMGQFEKLTGIPKKRCQIVMKELVEKNIIIKGGSFWKPTYGPQKNYKQWKFQTTPQEEGTPVERGKVPPWRGVNLPPWRGDTKERKETKQKKGGRKRPPALLEECKEVVNHLNTITSSQYRASTKETVKLISGRLSEGYTVEDCKAVIRHRWERWKDDPKMREFLRPNTLFRPANFEGYLQEARRCEKEGIGNDGQPVHTITVGHIRQDLTSYLIRVANDQMSFEEFEVSVLGRYRGQTVNTEAITEAWELAHKEFGGNDGR